MAWRRSSISQISQHLEADLRDAAMLVYLTASEGLGSGALLAMSAGVPVIASRVGGLPEIVRHRETGLLVEEYCGIDRGGDPRIDARIACSRAGWVRRAGAR